MFLTRVVLNPERSGTHKLISNPRNIHAAIQKSFPDNGDRILWKLDTTSRDPQIYIFSPSIPSVEHIVEQAGRGNDINGVITKDYSPVVNDISEDKVYRIQVEANITKENKGKRIPLFKQSEIENWLHRQAANNGFEVVSALLVEPKIPMSVKKDGHQVTLERNLLDFKAKITDAEKFRSFIKNGIGRGKAYGLGMILLAKP